MHVCQLLFDFPIRLYFKRKIFRLAKFFTFAKFAKITFAMISIPIANTETGLSLPAMHELTKLARLRKPHQSMNMILHHDEPNAACILHFQLLIKNSQQYFFRVVLVEQLSATVASKGHKMGPKLIIKNPAFVWHMINITNASCCCAAPVQEPVLPCYPVLSMQRIQNLAMNCIWNVPN